MKNLLALKLSDGPIPDKVLRHTIFIDNGNKLKQIFSHQNLNPKINKLLKIAYKYHAIKCFEVILSRMVSLDLRYKLFYKSCKEDKHHFTKVLIKYVNPCNHFNYAIKTAVRNNSCKSLGVLLKNQVNASPYIINDLTVHYTKISYGCILKLIRHGWVPVHYYCMKITKQIVGLHSVDLLDLMIKSKSLTNSSWNILLMAAVKVDSMSWLISLLSAEQLPPANKLYDFYFMLVTDFTHNWMKFIKKGIDTSYLLVVAIRQKKYQLCIDILSYETNRIDLNAYDHSALVAAANNGPK